MRADANMLVGTRSDFCLFVCGLLGAATCAIIDALIVY